MVALGRGPSGSETRETQQAADVHFWRTVGDMPRAVAVEVVIAVAVVGGGGDGGGDGSIMQYWWHNSQD